MPVLARSGSTWIHCSSPVSLAKVVMSVLGDGAPAADPQIRAQPFLQACQTVQNERSTTRRLGGGRFAHLFVLQFVFPVGR